MRQQVADGSAPRGDAVEAELAGTLRGFGGVSFEPVSGADTPNVDGFEWLQLGGSEKGAISRRAAIVVEIDLRKADAVQLAIQLFDKHRLAFGGRNQQEWRDTGFIFPVERRPRTRKNTAC
jgi:hypothetical protein